jgi:ubiquitin thioesterase protein OTUB1
MHLRFVASAYLRVHADGYEPFLVAEMISIDEFCAMHVEAFGRESDHLQIISLTKALDVPVEVIYLDGGREDEAAVHEFWPDEAEKGQRAPLQLIYRPGK